METGWHVQDDNIISELSDDIGESALIVGTLNYAGENYEQTARRMTMKTLNERRLEIEAGIRRAIDEANPEMSEKDAIDQVLARAYCVRRDKEREAAEIIDKTREKWD